MHPCYNHLHGQTQDLVGSSTTALEIGDFSVKLSHMLPSQLLKMSSEFQRRYCTKLRTILYIPGTYNAKEGL